MDSGLWALSYWTTKPHIAAHSIVCLLPDGRQNQNRATVICDDVRKELTDIFGDKGCGDHRLGATAVQDIIRLDIG